MAKSRAKISTELTNFTILHNEFIDSQFLDGYEKLVFIAIKRHLNSESFQAFPSIKTLCKHTGLSKPTVIKAVKSLEEKNILTVEHRSSDTAGFMSNLYTLMDYKDMWQVASKEELEKIAKSKQYEWAKQIIESAGGRVVKEKEPDVEPTKAQQQALKKNQFDMFNSTTNTKDCQATRYTLSQIKELYDYEILISQYKYHNKEIDCVINILYDVLNTTKQTIRVCGEDKPAMVVISKLMKLNYEDIYYAIEKFTEQTDRINNVTAYMLTLLYRAKEQSSLDITNQVQYDMNNWKDIN